MPQMSPMDWFFLMIFILLIYFMLMVYLYYVNNLIMKFDSMKLFSFKKMIKLNW
uniref:ATP synthase F0 subunit 8 n=1 Tax=Spathius agrili TaxID=314331 RepID=D8KZT8_SPAAG|nr:ATP synthase F0 subunit 8 [Spathius agrili]ACJ06257.1 ATP synthase F0 subunit 8 [Spathius agrili]